MSAVDVTKDLWQIQNVVGFVSIIKWHITCLYIQFCLRTMQTVSVNYTIKYELDFATEYKWLNTNQCYNAKTGRIIKQVYVSGSIGYCINRKFYTLTNLRKHLVKQKKEYLPF